MNETLSRPPAVAGTFYPDRTDELRAQVEDLLARAPDADIEGEVVALVAPHAGYPYSGATAAAAYRQVRGISYDVVVIAAPSHFEPCGGISIFEGAHYETPLGAVAVDTPFAEAMAAHPGIRRSSLGHRVLETPEPGRLPGEHAIEVQLPFVQVALGDVPVVPIVMDTPDDALCDALADALVAAAGDRRVLLVASSDLYHGQDYDACVTTDNKTLDLIAAFDADAFVRRIASRDAQACGAGPVSAWMRAARALGATRAHVVAHTNSNDAVGRRGGYVVGYGAVVFTRSALEPAGLDADARRCLLDIARDAVQRAASRRDAPTVPDTVPSGLAFRAGAFVTLWKSGDLRGCIGSIEGTGSIAETVGHVAYESAVADPRFGPVTPEELPDITLDISILSPLQRAASPDDILVGRHGVVIRLGTKQGLLLPEVPVRQGWNRERFLQGLCRKAGLPEDAWRDPAAELLTFTATTLSDS